MSHPNPLLRPWTAPFGLPPFADIRAEHFAAAFAHTMAAHRAELDAIAANPEPPTFANTCAALDAAGHPHDRVAMVFENLCESATSPALQAVQRDLAGPLAAHGQAVWSHAGVFARLDAVRAAKPALAPQQQRLLERQHLAFVRSGARLNATQAARYSEITQRLAQLSTAFAQQVLADEAEFALVLRSEDELRGLPGFLRASTAQAALERGLPAGCHAVTLARSSATPFLTFSERRDLREQVWRAWTTRGEAPGRSTWPLIAETLALRRERAALHGHASFAEYALADTMAATPEAVRELLDEVWRRALRAAEAEQQALLAMARSHGMQGDIEPWDWAFWSEKVRQTRYALAESELKPYFTLDGVVAAVFDCAQRLFGLTFTPRDDLPTYHPDVQAYEVRGRAGEVVAVFLHDNFARQTKQSGAWMSLLDFQSTNRGVAHPIVLNNNNFARGAAGEPTLLSLDDARTLFHEFGHGLHGMLSRVDWNLLAGTNVLRDFVELPSQLFEHWIEDAGVLASHARHWQTGEPIAADLIARIQAARRWGQGFETVAYCASALVDLELHSLSDPARDAADLPAFERDTLARLGAPRAVGMRHRLPHFLHLFSGDEYASAYYVYLWAEVLEADAFNAFVEAGDVFDPATAARLAEHIYASGNTRDPREAYVAFRGRLPALEPLLAQRGLLSPQEGAPA